MMHWLIDESKSFIFDPSPSMKWRVAAVGGAILPYEGRKIWLTAHKTILKGSEYTDEGSICEVLDFLIKCQVKGMIRIGDTGHVSLQEAETFRQNWLTPHYASADTQNPDMQKSLRFHLDNLWGKGDAKFSIQEFFKVLNILDTITAFIQWTTQSLLKIRSIDLRKIKLIIDDQVKAALTTLRSFVHYFLCQRSRDGLFTCAPNSMNRLSAYIRHEGDKTFLDTTKLFDRLVVEEKANLDDKHPELKIADLLANFSRRALNGEFDIKVAIKLSKILVAVNPICFDNHQDITVKLPTQNQNAINMLLAIKPL